MALLTIKSKQTVVNHQFLVANIGEDNLILGYPFFEAINPQINWPTGTTKETITLLSHNKWDKESPKLEKIEWAKKVTIAQQLAEKATDKKEQTWEELVPMQYYRHGKVFSEWAFEQFLEKRPWDHTIDLKTNAPASIDSRVYPLSPKEKEEQRKFIKANLCLLQIRRSKSPYASGFFLIKKKDGKF